MLLLKTYTFLFVTDVLRNLQYQKAKLQSEVAEVMSELKEYEVVD